MTVRLVAASLPFAAAILVAGAPVSSDDDTGRWSYHENKDPMTDRATARISNVNGSSQLLISCEDAEDSDLQLNVRHFGKYIGRNGQVRVTYRFDEVKPDRDYWWLIHGSTVMPGRQADMLSFIRSMTGAKSLSFRVEADDYRNVDSSFDLNGVAEAVGRLAARCQNKALSRLTIAQQ